MKGQRNNQIRRLTDEQEIQMKEMYLSGKNTTELGKMFNIHRITVGKILKKYHKVIMRKGSGGQQNENHWNWQGGKTKTAKYIRFTPEYKEWRKKVFERDNYKCNICKKGGKLNADHMLPQCKYPEFITEEWNGRTLCESCHRKTATWGEKAKNWDKIGFFIHCIRVIENNGRLIHSRTRLKKKKEVK